MSSLSANLVPPRWLRTLSLPFGLIPGWGHIVLGKASRGYLLFFFFALFANFALLSFLAWPALAKAYVAPGCGTAAAIVWAYAAADLFRLAVWRHRPSLRPAKDELLREGMTRFLAGDLAAARAAYRRLVLLDREDPDGHFHLGTIAAAGGDWREARRLFKECLAVDAGRKWAEEARAELARLGAPSTKAEVAR